MDKTEKTIALVSHITTATILLSIKTNGLDKTLQDLRGACRLPLDKWKELNDDGYKGMINTINIVSKLLEEEEE
jgi:hypothetical protein